MRAIVQERFGRPKDVLQLRDVEQPAPRQGEVLVRVAAASVAKGDWLIATGQPYIARPSYGLKRPKQHVAGLEVAGTVETAGPDAIRFESGDEVFGWCNGAFADYVVVPEEQLVSKPSNVTFEEAAALPVSGFAALQAVRDCGRVEAGQRVLVIGASGGVGSLAVQIAKTFDAEVTGVASTKNIDLVRSLGAEHVIDYTQETIAGHSRIFDVIIDIAGNRPLSELRKVLAPTGKLVIVGGTGGAATMGFGRTVRAAVLSPFVKPDLVPLMSKPNRADLETLRDLAESGRIRAVVDQAYPLDQTPSVVEQLGAGRSSGKRVVTV